MDRHGADDSRAVENDTALRTLNLTHGEAQAFRALRAAGGVAEEIEELRHRMKDKALGSAERRALRKQVVPAADRLCNLLVLAVEELSASGNRAVRERLAEGVLEVRRRVVELGLAAVIERIERLHRIAAGARDSGVYPVGSAHVLKLRFAELMGNLPGFACPHELSPEQRASVLAAVAAINDLIEREIDLGMTRPLDRAHGTDLHPIVPRNYGL